MSGIYKAYDIRGIYGEDLTESVAEKIGRAFVTFLQCHRVVVGRDIRSHSESLSNALTAGMVALGAEVIDIGLCSTPINYFANGTLEADGSIMVTASHNPSEWNGFKLCRHNAIPISGESGIKDIEEIVRSEAFASPRTGGIRKSQDVKDAYWRMLRSHIEFKRKPKIAVDFANAMGSVEIAGLNDVYEIIPLYENLDGRFPNHEANPLKIETLDELRRTVTENGAEFGVAFDGDADRCGFVDENGDIVTMDLTTAVIGKEVLSKGPATILYDLRSSWVVKEYIESNGGKAIMSRVGHAFIKNMMRDHQAKFAGELAGHYYFAENFTAESSGLALIMLTNVIEKAKQPLSEIVAPLRKYYSTGEINSRVANGREVLEKIKQRYKDGRQFFIDGVTTEYKDWWFNVRLSNTEPLIRVILEAKSKTLMEEKRDEVLALVRA